MPNGVLPVQTNSLHRPGTLPRGLGHGSSPHDPPPYPPPMANKPGQGLVFSALPNQQGQVQTTNLHLPGTPPGGLGPRTRGHGPTPLPPMATKPGRERVLHAVPIQRGQVQVSSLHHPGMPPGSLVHGPPHGSPPPQPPPMAPQPAGVQVSHNAVLNQHGLAQATSPQSPGTPLGCLPPIQPTSDTPPHLPPVVSQPGKGWATPNTPHNQHSQVQINNLHLPDTPPGGLAHRPPDRNAPPRLPPTADKPGEEQAVLGDQTNRQVQVQANNLHHLGGPMGGAGHQPTPPDDPTPDPPTETHVPDEGRPPGTAPNQTDQGRATHGTQTPPWAT